MKKILLALPLLFPVLASAQEASDVDLKITDLGSIFAIIYRIIQVSVPIIIALAVLVFLWGVFRYVVSNAAEDKDKARGTMIWGIVGIFVMVSVWGLVGILQTTFGVNDTDALPVPELPTTNE
jgi:hypothetical protein